MNTPITHTGMRLAPAATLLPVVAVLLTLAGGCRTSAAQEAVSLVFNGTVESVDDDFGATGLQSGDTFTIFWEDIDPAAPAFDPEPGFAEVLDAALSVSLFFDSPDVVGADFFLEDSNSILLTSNFSQTEFSDGRIGFFGDGIDFQAFGTESSLDITFFNFSLDEPFDGPDGTDPTIPDSLDDIAEPLQFLAALDPFQSDPIDNGQGSFSSDIVSFSFFIDFVELDGEFGGDLPGDYNFDGEVNLDDYFVWRDDFGETNLLDADGNLDGVVDAADYTIWRDNLGAFLGLPDDGSFAVPTPEPAGLLTVVSAMMGLASWRLVRRHPNGVSSR